MAITTPEALMAEFAAKTAQSVHQCGNAVIAAAAKIQADAKQMAPVDTGMLRNSITRETRRSSTGAEAEVGPEANYGHFVENGTRNMAPQPYLLPAALRHEEAFLDAIEQVVGFSGSGRVGTSTQRLLR